LFVGYIVTGEDPLSSSKWTRYSSFDAAGNLQVGDIVAIKYNKKSGGTSTHMAVVYSMDSNGKMTFAQASGGSNNLIKVNAPFWVGALDKSGTNLSACASNTVEQLKYIQCGTYPNGVVVYRFNGSTLNPINPKEDRPHLDPLTPMENVVYIFNKDDETRVRPYEDTDLAKSYKEGDLIELVGSGVNKWGNTWYKTKEGTYVYSEDVDYCYKIVENMDAYYTTDNKQYGYQTPYDVGTKVNQFSAGSIIHVVQSVKNKVALGIENTWYKTDLGSFVYSENVSFCFADVEKNLNMTLKCKKDQNAYFLPLDSSKKVATLSNGSTVTAIRSVKNKFGNIWYQLSDYTFVYSGDVEAIATINIQVDNASPASGLPKIRGTGIPTGDLNKGSNFGLRGIITASENISSVTGTITYLYNGGNALPPVKVTPNSTSLNIQNSNINNNLKFGSLSEGAYEYKVVVTTVSGATQTVIDSEFTISHKTCTPVLCYDVYTHWIECSVCGALLSEQDNHFAICTNPTVCVDCEKTISDGIHLYLTHTDPTMQYDNNSHWYKCNACGEIYGKESHTISNGQCMYCDYVPSIANPIITTQPSSATVTAGKKASFTVAATGTELTYQWQYKDEGGSWTNSGYTNAKTATLTFTATAEMSGRQYRCKVTNSAGTTTSSTATLSVKPGITTQPSSAAVAAGNKATFKVVATGAGSYQWQYKDEGGSWTNSGYSSAKTATLSFTAKADMNGRQYRCKVTNSAGTTTSNAATLTVNSKPTITTQPSNATVTEGNKATFKVVASGTGLSYQWQYKDEGGSWTNSGYSSAKTATLTFTATAEMSGRQYRCKVTNSAGTTTSSTATLSVKPAITSQPSSATVTAGNKATFKVVASGASSYQWQYKSEGGSWTNSGYSSAKTATLSFTATADMNGRQYRCKVTNSGGTATSSTATLTVTVPKPTISTQPASATVAAGKKATFKVAATGTDLTYQWQYKNEGGSWANSGYTSAKTATLTFTAAADMSGRQYRCKVTNSAGTTTSSTVTLTVNSKPAITSQPSSAAVTAGNKATFKVVATGASSYQWQYKDVGGSWTDSGYSSAKTATLSFTATAEMSGRQYRCKITNSAGTTTSSTVTLSVKPGIATQPANTTSAAGKSAFFKVVATGTGLTYQWQYKDAGGSWTNSGYSSAKTATLSFTAAADMNGRQYRCKVTNSAGTTTSSTATLTVK